MWRAMCSGGRGLVPLCAALLIACGGELPSKQPGTVLPPTPLCAASDPAQVVAAVQPRAGEQARLQAVRVEAVDITVVLDEVDPVRTGGDAARGARVNLGNFAGARVQDKRPAALLAAVGNQNPGHRVRVTLDFGLWTLDSP